MLNKFALNFTHIARFETMTTQRRLGWKIENKFGLFDLF